MSDTLRLERVWSAEEWYLWCPDRTAIPGTAEKDWLVFCGWPKAAGMEGWTVGSRLFACALGSEGTADRIPVHDITPAGLPTGSCINPRFADGDEWPFVFFSIVWPGGRCTIASAILSFDTGNPVLIDAKTDILAFEAGSADQGPTNPAPLRRSDGTWMMAYRKAVTASDRVMCFAHAAHPEGPWLALPRRPDPGENVEDLFLWEHDGGDLGLILRDIGGTFSGKPWATLAAATSKDGMNWKPAEPPHLMNRVLPDKKGVPSLLGRVERPVRLAGHQGAGASLLVACGISDNSHSELRQYAWPTEEAALYSVKNPPQARATPANLAMPEPRKAAQASPGDIIDAVRSENLTYLSVARLQSLQTEVSRILEHRRVGMIVECGIALGGSGIVLAHAAAGKLPYRGYDVFSTIPEPSHHDDLASHARFEDIVAGLANGIGGDVYYGYQHDLLRNVMCNFTRHGIDLRPHRVSFVRGLFEDTLTFAPGDRIQLAHVDCDWFEGTLLCLERLAPQIAKWGKIIVDDFSDWPGCRRAVHGFLAQREDFILKDVHPHAIIQRVPC